MLSVQKYIHENGVEALKENFNITAVHYPNEGCYILSYNMITSPKMAPEVRDCRGLILSDDFNTVYCKPFTRFFNMGECQETMNFSFEHAQVLEKVDGSMINMWHHPKIGWCMATRKRAFGEGETSFGSITFHDLLATIVDFSKLNHDFRGYEDYTFTFEFVSPETKVVKDYGKERALYFLAMHNNKTCEFMENGRDIFANIMKNVTSFKNLKFPQQYDLHTYADVQKCIESLNNTDEGFVCYNYDTHVRVKVKNPRYLQIAYRRQNGGITEKSVVEMVFQNECDEYLAYYPNDVSIIMLYKNAYETVLNTINKEYDNIMSLNLTTRKEMASIILKSPYRSILFSMLDGSDINTAVNNLNIDSKIKLLRTVM